MKRIRLIFLICGVTAVFVLSGCGGFDLEEASTICRQSGGNPVYVKVNSSSSGDTSADNRHFEKFACEFPGSRRARRGGSIAVPSRTASDSFSD